MDEFKAAFRATMRARYERLQSRSRSWWQSWSWLQSRVRMWSPLQLRLPESQPHRTLAMLALTGLVTLPPVIAYYYWAVNRPLDFGEQPWVIEPGDTLTGVAAQLVERDVIDETLSLRVLARKDDMGRHIRSGEYKVPPSTSLTEFMNRIVDGKGQIGMRVTFIEGWTFRQMREKLRRAPKLKATTAALTDRQIMAKLGHPDLHPEGQFFPDTYYYTTGQSDLSVYRQAFRLMREKLDLAWQNRADGLAFETPEEALTLASIIEKETYIADEKPRIAGVFHNRLKKGMRLQTDPTVIYGLGRSYKGNITRKHLKTDTPYNTYTRYGLTPTPISLPGWDSLEAAVRPAITDDYYFVSKGGGRHQFSATLEQHNKAVREYIRGRKSG